jgi:hypothetical protein
MPHVAASCINEKPPIGRYQKYRKHRIAISVRSVSIFGLAETDCDDYVEVRTVEVA